MPYTSLKDANVKEIDGVKLSLEQANKIAAIADAVKRGGDKKYEPWAVAVATFKKSHIIKNGKWIPKAKKQNLLQEAIAKPKEKK